MEASIKDRLYLSIAILAMIAMFCGPFALYALDVSWRMDIYTDCLRQHGIPVIRGDIECSNLAETSRTFGVWLYSIPWAIGIGLLWVNWLIRPSRLKEGNYPNRLMAALFLLSSAFSLLASVIGINLFFKFGGIGNEQLTRALFILTMAGPSPLLAVMVCKHTLTPLNMNVGAKWAYARKVVLAIVWLTWLYLAGNTIFA